MRNLIQGVSLVIALMVGVSSAKAAMMLHVDGRVTSFTDDWVTVEFGRTVYTLDRKKLNADELKKVRAVNDKVALVVPVDAIIQSHVSNVK